MKTKLKTIMKDRWSQKVVDLTTAFATPQHSFEATTLTKKYAACYSDLQVRTCIFTQARGFTFFDDVVSKLADQQALRKIVRSLDWKMETPNSEQLKPGYDVWIKSPVLKDLVEQYAPDAICPSGWYKYDWKLILHMWGGEHNVITMKSLQEGIGVAAVLPEATIGRLSMKTKQCFMPYTYDD